MAYNTVGSPVNENNLDVWESELLRWHEVLDQLEAAINHAGKLYNGKNLVDELDSAITTANRLAAMTALKVGRIRRAQSDG